MFFFPYVITFESSCCADNQEKNIHQLVVLVFRSIILVGDKFRMQRKCRCKVGTSFKHGWADFYTGTVQLVQKTTGMVTCFVKYCFACISACTVVC